MTLLFITYLGALTVTVRFFLDSDELMRYSKTISSLQIMQTVEGRKVESTTNIGFFH